ncbi:DNA recombination protein RmuC [Nocardioides panzhihuensis]|uniref:DNA recombination protein RmuC n=1 Tax=Nocardioides panzhihuensis TaxID=860243 RepID=A0A7Z0IQR5_9ACTN|nr:DNA recombination protein RmuC [Nocardioides panzhihuensis]NYI75937.1 DNA recombination protein RmuC [Nocardioides panzhihuensis]
MEIWILVLGLVIGLVLGALLGVLWVRARSVGTVAAGMVDQAEVMQGLDRLSDQMQHLDRERARWQGQFETEVGRLQTETRTLSTALRKPQVRGRWGEMHLRRAVELAGLVDKCDFSEQVHLEDGRLRPDLVVHLSGNKELVVDSKVPLDAYLDAAAADNEDDYRTHLRRHTAQLRTHVDQLASKAYWRFLEESPEFVVLFVPAESFLSAALETEPGLIEYAAERRVVLASPTTLIALLRTVAHGWSHEALAEQAREIHRLGRDLHQRLGTMSTHLDGIGRSLNTAVTRYNQAIGSFDNRVLVAARRFNELSVTDDDLGTPRPVEIRAVERLSSVREDDRRAAENDGVPGPTVGSDTQAAYERS